MRFNMVSEVKANIEYDICTLKTAWLDTSRAVFVRKDVLIREMQQHANIIEGVSAFKFKRKMMGGSTNDLGTITIKINQKVLNHLTQIVNASNKRAVNARVLLSNESNSFYLITQYATTYNNNFVLTGFAIVDHTSKKMVYSYNMKIVNEHMVEELKKTKVLVDKQNPWWGSSWVSPEEYKEMQISKYKDAGKKFQESLSLFRKQQEDIFESARKVHYQKSEEVIQPKYVAPNHNDLIDLSDEEYVNEYSRYTPSYTKSEVQMDTKDVPTIGESSELKKMWNTVDALMRAGAKISYGLNPVTDMLFTETLNGKEIFIVLVSSDAMSVIIDSTNCKNLSYTIKKNVFG